MSKPKHTNQTNQMSISKLKKDKIYEKGKELLILGLKVSKPDLTDKQAEEVIVNVGNYIQLKKLKQKKQST